MLTVKICVQYEGNWTEKLSEYDVSGEFLASTFRNRRYSGIFTLETSKVDDALAVIDDYPTVERVRIIEDYDDPRQERALVTLFIEEQLTEFTPLQTLLYEGYLPLGSTSLQNGVDVSIY